MSNNEQPTTAAEQKGLGALAGSIEGLKAILDEVDSEVRQARFLFPNQENETLQWATLRRACGRINDITRIGVQRLVDPAAGPVAFFTPKEALDAVMANPPLNIPPAAEPIDHNAPKLVQGDGHVWHVEPNAVGMARHGNVIQAFAFQDGAGVQVFAKQVHADGMYADCWNVTGTIDCEKAIIATVFGGRNRMNKIAKFIRNGLLAARMRNRHYRMNRKARKEAANAERGDLCHED